MMWMIFGEVRGTQRTSVKEVTIDLPPINTWKHSISRVELYKLLWIWLDDLKWITNSEYITKKASTKRVYLLKIGKYFWKF